MTIPDETVERAAREMSDAVAAFATELRKWWSFDDRQMHTHSWHSREDFIDRVLPKLVAAQRLEARGEISEAQARLLRGSNATLRQALERLGSSEAFTSSHVIPHTPTGDELRARMEFARAALEAALSGKKE